MNHILKHFSEKPDLLGENFFISLPTLDQRKYLVINKVKPVVDINQLKQKLIEKGLTPENFHRELKGKHGTRLVKFKLEI